MGATAATWSGASGVFRAGGVIAMQGQSCVVAVCAICSMHAMTPLHTPTSGWPTTRERPRTVHFDGRAFNVNLAPNGVACCRTH